MRHRLLRATLDATDEEKEILALGRKKKRAKPGPVAPPAPPRPAEFRRLYFAQTMFSQILVMRARGVAAQPVSQNCLSGDKVLASTHRFQGVCVFGLSLKGARLRLAAGGGSHQMQRHSTLNVRF